MTAQPRSTDAEYREPFFGAGGVGLKYLSGNPSLKKVWINDIDIGIACMWTAIIQQPELFKTHVRGFVPSVEAFHRIRQELLALTEMPTHRAHLVDVGFKKLAIHQISYSGLGTKSGGPQGGAKQASIHKVDCRWSPKHLCKKIDKSHAFLAGLDIREGRCTNYDFSVLIGDESCDALLYLDPPYYLKGHHLYQHAFTREDHDRLSEALRTTRHPWVLSYDDCFDVRRLYRWAQIDDLDVIYNITATKDKETGECRSRMKAELLITRGQADAVATGTG